MLVQQKLTLLITFAISAAVMHGNFLKQKGKITPFCVFLVKFAANELSPVL